MISDQFNSSNSQTCNYAHDDLSRISNVNCGTAWQQAFGFDVFGNISKTGSLSFTPTYSAATNRINGGGYPASYDSNGNLTNDGLGRTYTWDVDGNPVTIADGSTSVNVTYDALGRAVENGAGSSYKQIVYGPDGTKLALMNGTSTLVKAFVALPGGGQAVYTASGLAYYRHADWLGSSRLASTPSRTLYFSGAYAPYGEDYAKTGTTDLSFTGQNQDTMSGLYDFMYRRYNPVQGRWMSPDPAGLAVADPANPQSWNRYGYVANQPLSAVDPLGLRMAWWDYFGGGGGGFWGPTYYVDGVPVTSSQFGGYVGSGGAVVCNGACPGPGTRIEANNHIYQWLASGQPGPCNLSSNGTYYCPATGYGWVDVGTIGSVSYAFAIRPWGRTPSDIFHASDARGRPLVTPPRVQNPIAPPTSAPSGPGNLGVNQIPKNPSVWWRVKFGIAKLFEVFDNQTGGTGSVIIWIDTRPYDPRLNACATVDCGTVSF